MEEDPSQGRFATESEWVLRTTFEAAAEALHLLSTLERDVMLTTADAEAQLAVRYATAPMPAAELGAELRRISQTLWAQTSVITIALERMLRQLPDLLATRFADKLLEAERAFAARSYALVERNEQRLENVRRAAASDALSAKQRIQREVTDELKGLHAELEALKAAEATRAHAQARVDALELRQRSFGLLPGTGSLHLMSHDELDVAELRTEVETMRLQLMDERRLQAALRERVDDQSKALHVGAATSSRARADLAELTAAHALLETRASSAEQEAARHKGRADRYLLTQDELRAQLSTAQLQSSATIESLKELAHAAARHSKQRTRTVGTQTLREPPLAAAASATPALAVAREISTSTPMGMALAASLGIDPAATAYRRPRSASAGAAGASARRASAPVVIPASLRADEDEESRMQLGAMAAAAEAEAAAASAALADAEAAAAELAAMKAAANEAATTEAATAAAALTATVVVAALPVSDARVSVSDVSRGHDSADEEPGARPGSKSRVELARELDAMYQRTLGGGDDANSDGALAPGWDEQRAVELEERALRILGAKDLAGLEARRVRAAAVPTMDGLVIDTRAQQLPLRPPSQQRKRRPASGSMLRTGYAPLRPVAWSPTRLATQRSAAEPPAIHPVERSSFEHRRDSAGAELQAHADGAVADGAGTLRGSASVGALGQRRPRPASASMASDPYLRAALPSDRAAERGWRLGVADVGERARVRGYDAVHLAAASSAADLAASARHSLENSLQLLKNRGSTASLVGSRSVAKLSLSRSLQSRAGGGESWPIWDGEAVQVQPVRAPIDGLDLTLR
jgi:SWI/SNF-related matrix-associated actin-dependent regulator 1 of chromatin subfamily A